MVDSPPPPSPDVVARRIDAFKRTGDPDALWPGLGEAQRVAAARTLERVTREVLAGSSRVPLDPEQQHTAYALGVAGHTTGIGPLVGRWIEDGTVVAGPEATGVFFEHLRHGRGRAARIEREVLPAIDALLALGIVPVVLKGFHTARVYFEEPGVRPMSDVDLLVPPDRIADAERALAAAGYRPEGAALKPYKRDWIRSDIDQRVFSVERSDEASKWSLELHASLDRVYHPGAVARLDAAREMVEPLEIARRPLAGLSPALLVVYLACHCSQELNNVRLVRLLELIRVVRVESRAGRFDWRDVLALVRRIDGARFAYPAFALVEALAPGTVDADVLAAGRSDSTAAALHTVDRLGVAGGSLDDRGVIRQLMWTSGPLAVLHRVFRAIWPASGWRARLRRLRTGSISVGAPEERER
jgi:hypothetical protein